MFSEQPIIRHKSYISENTVVLNYGDQQRYDVKIYAGHCVGLA